MADYSGAYSSFDHDEEQKGLWANRGYNYNPAPVNPKPTISCLGCGAIVDMHAYKLHDMFHDDITSSGIWRTIG